MNERPLRLASLTMFGLLLGACAVTVPDWVPPPAPEGATKQGDVCAPGAAAQLLDSPLATCAVHDEVHAPDLAAAPSGGDLQTSSLRPLDNGQPVAAAAPRSCAAGNGAGIKTCGANGGDDCCKVARVPAGRAGTIEVRAFDLGVYEVTSGRFAAFVAATGGNLRKAAEDGNWPGWKPSWTAKLPASRAEVDTALGPACTNRSNVREYGALTWPSPDIEQAVDGLITDQNARAADIRADARPERLLQKPINCTSFHIAAAFCAWDGGRLPSPDEWAYAAMGGEELRKYPWGSDYSRDKLVTDFEKNTASFTWPEDFPFFGNGMNAYHIAPPGRKAGDRARWGHQDMGGNLVEWTDSGNVDLTTTVRGGSWEGHPAENTSTFGNYPVDRTYGSLGLRCAYGAAPAPTQTPAATATVDVRKDLDPNKPIAFRVPSAAPADGVALFACGTFVSTDAACEGKGAGRALGFAYRNAATGLLPLYRCGSISTVLPDVCARANVAVAGTQGFAIPGPPSTWLRSVYQAALNRDVDVVGHEGWLTSIDRGGCSAATLGAVLKGILTSPELEARNLDPEAKVEALYRAGLSRAPDPEGRANALAFLGKMGTFAQLVDGVVASPEFAGLAAGRCSN